MNITVLQEFTGNPLVNSIIYQAERGQYRSRDLLLQREILYLVNQVKNILHRYQSASQP